MEGNKDDFRASDHLGLIWPEKLIAELAESRKTSHFAIPLAIINFILSGVLALLLGPLSLIILAISEDVNFINDTFTPVMLRISLLIMGAIAISVLVDMIQIWRERPQRSLMAAVFGLGTILIGAIIWLGGLAAGLAANQLTLLFILIIAATLAFAKVTAKLKFAPERAHNTLNISLATALAFAVVETGATSIYLLNQNTQVKEDQAALEAAAAAQAAARIDGISAGLSDMIYTICQGKYDPIYIATGSAVTATGTTGEAGLFECRDSHRVYSVSGPLEYGINSVTGRAFYFGVTSDPLVTEFFPADSGVRYLYRDLLGSVDKNRIAPPSELVLLAPAPNEEILVNLYLENLLGFLDKRDDDNDLHLSIFYSPELNSVTSTRDFILIAAVNTIAMLDYLPGGNSYTAYLNGTYGTYAYSQDQILAALTELGLSPLLYSSQTRDALNSRRHITLTLERKHTYTADELRELLYANFVDPLV